MYQGVIDKINATNQKYLKPLLEKGIPEKMMAQLQDMDWRYLDQIHSKEQARGKFAPLGAMELAEIETKKEE
ncbi:MAG: UDPGP type 1 family protein, partial [Agathobacter sp.]|nr:UDPGP type 1 family protein [Agathobacter sp.]